MKVATKFRGVVICLAVLCGSSSGYEAPISLLIHVPSGTQLVYTAVAVECVLSNRTDQSLLVYGGPPEDSPFAFFVTHKGKTRHVEKLTVYADLHSDPIRIPLPSIGPYEVRRFTNMLVMDYAKPFVPLFVEPGEFEVQAVYRYAATGEARSGAAKVNFRGPTNEAERIALNQMSDPNVIACLQTPMCRWWLDGGGSTGRIAVAVKVIADLGAATPFGDAAENTLRKWKKIEEDLVRRESEDREKQKTTASLQPDQSKKKWPAQTGIRGAIAEALGKEVLLFSSAMREGNADGAIAMLAEDFRGPGRMDYARYSVKIRSEIEEIRRNKEPPYQIKVEGVFRTLNETEYFVRVLITTFRDAEDKGSTRRHFWYFRKVSDQWRLFQVDPPEDVEMDTVAPLTNK